MKQLKQDLKIRAYIHLKQRNILETFASVINGEAPIEKQITDKESKKLDEQLRKIFLAFDKEDKTTCESKKIIEKEISDEELIKIF